MRFIGSKKKLLPNIKHVLDKHLDGSEKTFVDLFAGSNDVGKYFKPKYRIISNDLLSSSYVTAKAIIENNQEPHFKKLKINPFTYLNSKDLSNYSGGFITNHYSPAGRAHRMYFRVNNAKRIDFIRTTIRKWYQRHQITKVEFYYLLNALIQAAPYVSNITGTYGAYLKNWDKRSYKHLKIYPYHVINNHRANQSYRTDSVKLVHQLKGDIVYIDTPYNTRQYAPNYHILETIALYDNPKIHGKTGMRPYKNEKSSFSQKRYALKSMKKLLHNLDIHHVLISYSTDGIIPIKNLVSICKREAKQGTFHLYKVRYRKYKSKIVRKSKLYELLFYFQPKYYWKKHSKKVKKYIKSPLNYVGGKYKLLPQIFPLFPNQHIDTFVDLFSGGANVGININADKVIFNDINTRINGLFRYLQGKKPSQVVKNIKRIINHYHLSKTNKAGFLKLRNNYNQTPTPLKLYVLVSYSFNYQFRFNNHMRYNNPFGKNRSHFTINMKKHLVQFIKRLNNMNAKFIDDYFTKLDLSKLTAHSFVYADPPYLITDGSYNDGNRGFVNWTIKQELQLYHLLDRLDKRHIKFALSNVLIHKGVKNKNLIKWAKSHHYIIHKLNYSYRNASYNTKHLPSQEILITNY